MRKIILFVAFLLLMATFAYAQTSQRKTMGSTYSQITIGTATITGSTYWGAANAKSTVTVAGALTLNSSLTATALTANSGALVLYSRTIAQLDALTPTATGACYYCNDCVDSAVCISSGTGTGAFVQISSATVHCN